ncbi:hypothetical protein K2X33_14210, partial [bacterium]|nr:hypothetical protein [bacterium]
HQKRRLKLRRPAPATMVPLGQWGYAVRKSVLVFGLFLSLVSFGSSEPYGSHTLDYLVKNSTFAATVARAQSLGGSVAEIQWNKTLHGTPPAKSRVGFVQKLPQAGDLVFVTVPKEGGDAYITSSVGILAEGSDRYNEALKFLKLTTIAEKSAWAIEELKSGDHDRRFGAEYMVLHWEAKDFSEDLITALLDNLGFQPGEPDHYLVWIALAKTDSRQVRDRFTKWVRDEKLHERIRKDLLTNLTSMPSAKAILEDWLLGKEGVDLQDYATLGWLIEESKWDDDKEKALKGTLAHTDPRVRLRAIDDLVAHDFYHAGPPFTILSDQLKLANELPTVKLRIILALGKAGTGSFEASAILKRVALDKAFPKNHRQLAMREVSRLLKFDLGKTALKEIQAELLKTGETDLERVAAQYLRTPEGT